MNSNLVPLGRSPALPIESLAFGVEPGVTVCAFAVGVYFSASLAAGVTKYVAEILSVEPSG